MKPQVWRTTPVFLDGLGDPNNTHLSSFDEFHGKLYIGLRNVEDGGEVWRSSDGLIWDAVFTGGLGKIDNGRPYGLIRSGNYLYVAFSNLETGAAVWRIADGSSREQVGLDGCGESKNGFADYFGKGAIVFEGSLYFGAHNFGNGAQIYTATLTTTVTGTFSDVPPDHWAISFIEALYAAGLTPGYPDGTYRPENQVTRAEMPVFLVNAFDLPLP